MNLSIPLCYGLAEKGHDVKVIGLGYKNEEHLYPFSIFPAQGFTDVTATLSNLHYKLGFDIFICALDIPHQEKFLQWMSANINDRNFKYFGIMPIEAGPLCKSWAFTLMAMDKSFIISEYGLQEAKEAFVSNAEYIQLGIDTEMWRVPSPEERTKLRKSIGMDDEQFIVLSVADNQERKNPHKLLETYAEFAKDKDNTMLVYVTRENNPAGARLRDYAGELGILKELLLFERGIPFKQLWALYAISDVFLLPSKAEGAGLPIFEAMSVGLPVVATNCTSITELLKDGRGLLVDYEYIHRDCFGNGLRYWFNNTHGVYQLNTVYKHGFNTKPAREYIEKRTWDVPVEQLHNAIMEYADGK
jgi:glycosyltransferase involved in cell wall biosynthesis